MNAGGHLGGLGQPPESIIRVVPLRTRFLKHLCAKLCHHPHCNIIHTVQSIPQYLAWYTTSGLMEQPPISNMDDWHG